LCVSNVIYANIKFINRLKLNFMKRLLLISAVVLLCAGTAFAQRNRVNGSGKVIRQERTVPAFDKIEVSNAFKLLVKQGSPQSLVIEIDDNVMEYVETTVSGGKLRIGFKSNSQINDVQTIAAHITVPNLTGIEAHGASNVTLETSFNVSGNMKIDLSGAAKLSGKELAVSGTLDVEISGASQMELAMSASSAKIDLSGAAKLSCEKLTTRGTANLELSGASNMKSDISANTVAIEASGASKLTSRLSASSVAIDASSAARVELSGKVATQTVSASGGASVNLKELDGNTATVTASGGARVNVGSASIGAVKTSGGASVNKE
jgi:hypothetical protein